MMSEDTATWTGDRRSAAPISRADVALAVLVLAGVSLTRLYSYVLFHSIAEVFSIVVTFGIFMVFYGQGTHFFWV